MGFIERAFTPPGAGSNPPGSPANPLVPPPAAAAAAPVAPPPTPPTLPQAPSPPTMFAPGQAPGQRQRVASTTATTMLGAAATGGQTARKTLLGQ